MLNAVNNYMQKKNITPTLQYSIREYIDYYFEQRLEEDIKTEQHMLEILSEPLKRQLLIESNKLVLRDSPVFSENFSKSVIQRTA